MLRTQVSLTEAQKRLLDRESAESGLSLSELVRRAIVRCYGVERVLDDDLRRLRSGFGAWDEREETGDQYVERLRPAQRLAST